ncbi:Pescadillo homolog [Nesidiocoris tenuis]|nr:Pescadillo homolog [Nesidiocoris tenuis]
MESQPNQLQIRFVTKQDRYSVPDNPFAVPSSIVVKELNALLRSLIDESPGQRIAAEFDFIAGGELVVRPLGDHLARLGVSAESVVDVEYLERRPPPEALDCLIHDDWVSSVDVCRRAIVTGCYDNTAHLWTTTGEHKCSVSGHSGPIKAVVWAGEKFVTGSHDETCMVWEWDTEENTVRCTDICRGHTQSVECLSVSPDGGRFASGGWDKFLKIWPLDDDGESGRKKARGSSATKAPRVTLKGHKECVTGVCWIDDVQIATCSMDHTIRIWDAEMNSSVREIGSAKSFLGVDFSPSSGLLATGAADRLVRLYDPRSGEGQVVKVTLSSHTAWVPSVKWSAGRDTLLVSGSYDRSVKMWDLRSPTVPLYEMEGHEEKVLCTDWSLPDLIVSGSADNTLRVFRV